MELSLVAVFRPKSVVKPSQVQRQRLVAQAALRGATFEKIIEPRANFLDGDVVRWRVIWPEGRTIHTRIFNSRYDAARSFMDIRDWEEDELERKYARGR